MEKIVPLEAAATTALLPGWQARGASSREASFSSALKKALESVSADQGKADELQRLYQLGDSKVSIEETILATQSASISFQGLVQVRNRLVSAYHDIMNMQI